MVASPATPLTERQKAALWGQQPWSMLARNYGRAVLELKALSQCTSVLAGGQQAPILKWPTGDGVLDIDMNRVVSPDNVRSESVARAIFEPLLWHLHRAVHRSLKEINRALMILCSLYEATTHEPQAVLPSYSDRTFSDWWLRLQKRIQTLDEQTKQQNRAERLQAALFRFGDDIDPLPDPADVLELLNDAEKGSLIQRLEQLEKAKEAKALAPCLILAQLEATGALEALTAVMEQIPQPPTK